jgi:hypothetical protein
MGRRPAVVILDDAPQRAKPSSTPSATSTSSLPAWFYFVALSPVFLPLFFIWRYSVNLIWNDEWDMTDLLVAAHRGVLGWKDFWALHNEHRLVIPYGIMFVLARLTKLDLRVEMVFGVLLMVLTALFLRLLMESTSDSAAIASAERDRRIPAWAWRWLAVTFLIFSVIQYENFLFGFGAVCNFLPMAFITGAMALIFRRGVNWATVLGAGLLIECASLSLANGLLGWPMMFVALCAVEDWSELIRRRGYLIAWVVMTAISIGTFFIGYQNNRWADWYYVASLWTRIRYFFTFLGQPLTYGTFAPQGTATAVGFVLVLLWLICLAYAVERAFRAQLGFVRRTLPWLSLSLYSLGSALMGARGRAGIGLAQATNSRYTSISIYLLICIILVFPMVLRDMQRRGLFARITEKTDAILGSMRALVAVGLLLSTCWSFIPAYGWYREKKMGQAHLAFIRFIDEPNRKALVSDHTTLRDAALTLNEMGYIHPPLISDSDISRMIPKDAERDAAQNGAVEGAQQLGNASANIWGWATVPNPRRPADAVVFAYTTPEGAIRCCGLADVMTARADVVKMTKDPDLLYTGWSNILPMSRLPDGKQNIQCFAYDAERQLVFPLLPPSRTSTPAAMR